MNLPGRRVASAAVRASVKHATSRLHRGLIGLPRHASHHGAAQSKVEASNLLPDLRERLKAEHAAVGTALRRSVERSMAAGDILLEAKAQLGHGEWLPWLASCDISERTAQRYMRLARHRAVISQRRPL